MITNPITHLHAEVWRVRAEIDHAWLTPSPIDCLRYAVTEVAEAMDAWLRAQRPDNARNNSRQMDVLDELGDCALMLCSTLPLDKPPIQRTSSVHKITLDELVYVVARILPRQSQRMIGWALDDIFAYPSFTPTVALLRLERIRVKHTTEIEKVGWTEWARVLEQVSNDRGKGFVDQVAYDNSSRYITDWRGDKLKIKLGWRDGLRLAAQRYAEIQEAGQ